LPWQLEVFQNAKEECSWRSASGLQRVDLEAEQEVECLLRSGEDTDEAANYKSEGAICCQAG
jgi:hypothetical protein